MDCLFCSFVAGTSDHHVSGLPFLALRQTTHTLTFLSAYQPDTTAGHVLVIPRQHAEYLEDIDQSALHALIDEVATVSKAMRQVHPATNVLLNNGKAAGQHEPHVHFHVIPRELDDHLVVDSEPGSVLSEVDYRTLHEECARLLQQSQ